jgi:hypothetical protein
MADLPFSGLPLDPSINAAPLQSLYAPTPQIPTEIASRGGMFGGNAQMALMAAISGLMARRHPQVSQMMQNMLQMRQQQALAQQERQQGIQDDFTKFKQQYDYKLANPAPDVPDIQERIDTLNKISPGLGDTYAQNYARNGGGSMIQFVDPATGQRYAMPSPAPTTLPPIGSVIDDPRKAGGQTPPASGNFLGSQ